ncbi:hypothetical protein TNIN_267851 [Trichonephila inaurata madagascariensis]|uniref:Uncharacterized protein n=1 Tax=Trichonephila inaurata madagascariensis TaxID=2747483 RepID=A0A8X6WWX7_9ARAC|nr:hypothetical protein TNIN_267851 [Trichonephila inaurata madagascariensis]
MLKLLAKCYERSKFHRSQFYPHSLKFQEEKTNLNSIERPLFKSKFHLCSQTVSGNCILRFQNSRKAVPPRSNRLPSSESQTPDPITLDADSFCFSSNVLLEWDLEYFLHLFCLPWRVPRQVCCKSFFIFSF